MVHVPESSQSDYSILRINIKSGNNMQEYTRYLLCAYQSNGIYSLTDDPMVTRVQFLLSQGESI